MDFLVGDATRLEEFVEGKLRLLLGYSDEETDLELLKRIRRIAMGAGALTILDTIGRLVGKESGGSGAGV